MQRLLAASPAVVLLGPRQVGKTTLARAIVDERGGAYVDLERPSDLAKVGDIEQYCTSLPRYRAPQSTATAGAARAPKSTWWRT